MFERKDLARGPEEKTFTVIFRNEYLKITGTSFMKLFSFSETYI